MSSKTRTLYLESIGYSSQTDRFEGMAQGGVKHTRFFSKYSVPVIVVDDFIPLGKFAFGDKYRFELGWRKGEYLLKFMLYALKSEMNDFLANYYTSVDFTDRQIIDIMSCAKEKLDHIVGDYKIVNSDNALSETLSILSKKSYFAYHAAWERIANPSNLFCDDKYIYFKVGKPFTIDFADIHTKIKFKQLHFCDTMHPADFKEEADLAILTLEKDKEDSYPASLLKSFRNFEAAYGPKEFYKSLAAHMIMQMVHHRHIVQEENFRVADLPDDMILSMANLKDFCQNPSSYSYKGVVSDIQFANDIAKFVYCKNINASAIRSFMIRSENKYFKA